MKKVEYFKAARRSNRFRENQKVWVALNAANHLYIWYRFRGKGRYVKGLIDKESSAISVIFEIDVSDDFAERVKRGGRI